MPYHFDVYFFSWNWNNLVEFVDLYQFLNFEQFAWRSKPAFISTYSICQYPTTYDSDGLILLNLIVNVMGWMRYLSILVETYLLHISVLEPIQTKGPYPEQILPQHESWYPIGLISARIKILHIGNFFTL